MKLFYNNPFTELIEKRRIQVLIDFKQTLKSIIDENGINIIFDSEVCESLLANHFTEHKAIQNILLIAQKEGVPHILHRTGNKSYVALKMKMEKILKDRFTLPDKHGFFALFACFAVDTWAYALDVQLLCSKNKYV